MLKVLSRNLTVDNPPIPCTVHPMFYVIYSPATALYESEDGCLVPFDEAERYSLPDRALQNDRRWVGPCGEGEEP